MGAETGGGFVNTSELRVMKFKEEMRTPDENKWLIAVKEELIRF